MLLQNTSITKVHKDFFTFHYNYETSYVRQNISSKYLMRIMKTSWIVSISFRK